MTRTFCDKCGGEAEIYQTQIHDHTLSEILYAAQFCRPCLRGFVQQARAFAPCPVIAPMRDVDVGVDVEIHAETLKDA